MELTGHTHRLFGCDPQLQMALGTVGTVGAATSSKTNRVHGIQEGVNSKGHIVCCSYFFVLGCSLLVVLGSLCVGRCSWFVIL